MRDKSQRHHRLKHIPHPGEHKRADGKFDLQKAITDAPAIIQAIQSGNPEVLDVDMTDPDGGGEYYVIFRMKAK